MESEKGKGGPDVEAMLGAMGLSGLTRSYKAAAGWRALIIEFQENLIPQTGWTRVGGKAIRVAPDLFAEALNISSQGEDVFTQEWWAPKSPLQDAPASLTPLLLFLYGTILSGCKHNRSSGLKVSSWVLSKVQAALRGSRYNWSVFLLKLVCTALRPSATASIPLELKMRLEGLLAYALQVRVGNRLEGDASLTPIPVLQILPSMNKAYYSSTERYVEHNRRQAYALVDALENERKELKKKLQDVEESTSRWKADLEMDLRSLKEKVGAEMEKLHKAGAGQAENAKRRSDEQISAACRAAESENQRLRLEMEELKRKAEAQSEKSNARLSKLRGVYRASEFQNQRLHFQMQQETEAAKRSNAEALQLQEEKLRAQMEEWKQTAEAQARFAERAVQKVKKPKDVCNTLGFQEQRLRLQMEKLKQKPLAQDNAAEGGSAEADELQSQAEVVEVVFMKAACKMETLEDEVQERQRRCEELEGKLARAEEMNAELRDRVRAADSAKMELQNEMDALKQRGASEAEAANSKLESLRSEYQVAQRVLLKTTCKLETLEARNTSLVMQLEGKPVQELHDDDRKRKLVQQVHDDGKLKQVKHVKVARFI